MPLTAQTVDGDFKSPSLFFLHDFTHGRQRFNRVLAGLVSRDEFFASTEQTRKNFKKILHLLKNQPEKTDFAMEILFLHMHESGTNEIERISDVFNVYLLKSYGPDPNYNYVEGLQIDREKTLKMISQASQRLLRSYYRSYGIKKEHPYFRLINATPEQISELIVFFLEADRA